MAEPPGEFLNRTQTIPHDSFQPDSDPPQVRPNDNDMERNPRRSQNNNNNIFRATTTTHHNSDPSEHNNSNSNLGNHSFENHVIVSPLAGAAAEPNPNRFANNDSAFSAPETRVDEKKTFHNNLAIGKKKPPPPSEQQQAPPMVNLAARRKYRSEKSDHHGNTIGEPAYVLPNRRLQQQQEEKSEIAHPDFDSEITPPTTNFYQEASPKSSLAQQQPPPPVSNTVIRMEEENENNSLLKLHLVGASLVENTVVEGGQQHGGTTLPEESTAKVAAAATTDPPLTNHHHHPNESPATRNNNNNNEPEPSDTVLGLQQDYDDNTLLKLNMVGASIVESTVMAEEEGHKGGEDPPPPFQEPYDQPYGKSDPLPDPSPSNNNHAASQTARWAATQAAMNHISQDDDEYEYYGAPEQKKPTSQGLDVPGELPDETIYETGQNPAYPHQTTSSVQDSTVLDEQEVGREVRGGVRDHSVHQKSATEIGLEEDANEISVLGMPMIAASLVDESTESMIDLSRLNSQSIPNQPRQHDPRSLSARSGPLFFLHQNQDRKVVHLVKQLRNQGFPLGLATEVCVEVMRSPYRFWVIDNNPLLQRSANHQMMQFNPERGLVEIIPCSYWAEMIATVEDHIWMADLLGLTTIFRYLRGESGEEFSVGRFGDVSIDEALKRIHHCQVKERRPPWELLFQHIRGKVTEWNRSGAPAVLVMTGMRIPSDEESAQKFYQAAKSLKGLKLTIVVRMSSNDPKAFMYFWSLQRHLSMCVVADYLEHQRLASRQNPWLNYSLPLHRSREMGFMPRLLDTLDQRLLTKDELRLLLVALFGRRVMLESPDLHTQWSDFYHFLLEVNENEGRHWRLHTNTMEPWIDMRILHERYGEEQLLQRRRRPSEIAEKYVEI